MDAIDLLALLSFAVLIVSWAILPASGYIAKKTEEQPAVRMNPVHEN